MAMSNNIVFCGFYMITCNYFIPILDTDFAFLVPERLVNKTVLFIIICFRIIKNKCNSKVLFWLTHFKKTLTLFTD